MYRLLTVAVAGRGTGGRYGVGNRIKLRYTRAIIDAIHSGELKAAQTSATPMFSLAVRSPRAWRYPKGFSWGLAVPCCKGCWTNGATVAARVKVGHLQTYRLPMQHSYFAGACLSLVVVRIVAFGMCHLNLVLRQGEQQQLTLKAVWMMRLAKFAASLISCGRAAQVPVKCSGVPENILNPAAQWADKAEFDDTLSHLADLYEVRHKSRLRQSCSSRLAAQALWLSSVDVVGSILSESGFLWPGG